MMLIPSFIFTSFNARPFLQNIIRLHLNEIKVSESAPFHKNISKIYNFVS